MVRYLASVALLAGCVSLSAQSVSPAVVEYTTASSGSFELVNDSLNPLVVTIEPKSFTIDRDGRASYGKLSSGVHLEMSSTSLRIPAHQRRTIFYRASADQYPAWFTIYSAFTGLPKRNGLNIQLELPHTVYLLGKTPVSRKDLEITSLQLDGSQLHGTIRNNGANMTRVQAFEVIPSRGGKKTDEGGFPLLPGMDRDFAFALPASSSGLRVVAKLARFNIERDLP